MASVAVLLFVCGCMLGSFVTVLAHRVPRGEGFVTGRSRCPSCGAQIRARDNTPVLSWLVLRGRCRDCGERISARYPIAELGLGALWAASYLILEDEGTSAVALGLALCAVLVAITLTDLELRVIPNPIVLAGALIAIAIVAVTDAGELGERALAGVIAGGFLFLVALA
jgi:leader peptidase (prepilin peptidase) / N-methyltransferase